MTQNTKDKIGEGVKIEWSSLGKVRSTLGLISVDPRVNRYLASFLNLSVTQVRRGFNEPVNVHRLWKFSELQVLHKVRLMLPTPRLFSPCQALSQYIQASDDSTWHKAGLQYLGLSLSLIEDVNIWNRPRPVRHNKNAETLDFFT